jgi:hypothetical protein
MRPPQRCISNACHTVQPNALAWDLRYVIEAARLIDTPNCCTRTKLFHTNSNYTSLTKHTKNGKYVSEVDTEEIEAFLAFCPFQTGNSFLPRVQLPQHGHRMTRKLLQVDKLPGVISGCILVMSWRQSHSLAWEKSVSLLYIQ